VARLLAAMKEKRVNAAQIAKRLNVSRSTVSRWLDEEHPPSADAQLELADMLEKPLLYFRGASDADMRDVYVTEFHHLGWDVEAKVLRVLADASEGDRRRLGDIVTAFLGGASPAPPPPATKEVLIRRGRRDVVSIPAELHDESAAGRSPAAGERPAAPSARHPETPRRSGRRR
jgi:transcriptional regulator with XRE-family HTH domain